MSIPKKTIPLFFICITFINSNIAAQPVDSSASPNTSDSNHKLIQAHPAPKNNPFPLRSFIAPVAMITYGFITLKSDPLQDINEDVKKVFWTDNLHHPLHIDNFLQFAPGVAVYALNIAGVKGKNNFRDRSIILFMSNIFLNVTVGSVKKLTQEQRPDGSSYSSFPSGHTAEAFANAEFLRQEYKDVSCWYGIAGYVTATATGLLRMYNNKHWLNDIISGAGVGIASTKLAYWLYPAISKKLFRKTNQHSFVIPTYQNKQAGLSMVYCFNLSNGVPIEH